MTGDKNSLESLLQELYRNNDNVITILGALQEVYQSRNERVKIEWVDFKGVTSTFVVPSLAYIQQQLKVLKNSQDQIFGVGLRSAQLRMPDGTFRKLIVGKVPSEEQPIQNIQLPTLFEKQVNRNQEILINPLPVINIDLTNQVTPTISKVKVKTIELDLADTEDLAYYETNIKNTSQSYDLIQERLTVTNIPYREYDEIFEIKERKSLANGLFSIQRIDRREVTLQNDTKETLTLYTLNTTLYKSTANNADVTIKVGDKLVSNIGSKDTIYEIVYLDNGTREVGVKLIEGSKRLDLGVNVLSIYNGFVQESIIKYPINLDKHLVIFIKPISNEVGIETTSWGNGRAFSTNDLVDINNNPLESISGELNDAYTALLTIAENNVIPTSKLVKQDPPVLSQDNFRVEVVNDHKKNKTSTESIKKKYGEKNKIESSIKALDAVIEKDKINLAQEKVAKTRALIDQRIKENYVKRRSLVNEFNSKVDEINANINQSQVFEPKYKIRGFGNYPAPKYKNEQLKTGKQEAIAMEWQYRYLSTDNASTETSSFKKVSNVNSLNQVATFSKWIPIPVTVIRQREGGGTGWKVEDLANPDQVSSNQVEISISQEENVEIRCRVISEVGYPYSMNYSDWSDPIIVNFPPELVNNIETIIETSRNEQILVKFNQQLSALKLDVHTNDSVEVGDKFYVHKLENIATTELTPENKPKSGQDVVNELNTRISQLEAKIAGENGIIAIAITDELGNKLQDVSNNTTAKISAGYYKDAVSSAPVPKGEIVSKLYFIEISNLSDADLELLSYVPGTTDQKAPNNSKYLEDNITLNPYYDNYTGYIANRDEYEFYRQYYYAPVSFRSAIENDVLRNHHNSKSYPYFNIPTFQSAQTKGQLAYSRTRDLTLNTDIYIVDNTSPQALTPILTGSIQQSFIWDGSQTIISPAGNGYESDFAVHILHPEVQSGSEFMTDFASYQGSGDPYPTLPKYSIDNSNLNAINVYYPPFYHSQFFNLESFQANGLYQLKYRDWVKIDQTSVPFTTPNNLPRKIGFSDNDKYLIGKNTCGSYLFLAPNLPDSLYVNNTFYNSGVVVKKSDSNKLRIPVIFQARMTDFYGAGTTGTGRIGGDPNKRNLNYAKLIGIDILVKNQVMFSFDLKVEMQYAPTSASTATLVNINKNTLSA